MGRNFNRNNFQNRKEEFRAKLNLNKQECDEMIAALTKALHSKRLTVMDLRKERIVQRAANVEAFLTDGIHTVKVYEYSNLDGTNINMFCTNNKQSNVKIMT
jgi:hypothetical protein